jgi:hypothetical protein
MAAAEAKKQIAAAATEAKSLRADIDARQKRLDTLQRDRDTLAAELKRAQQKSKAPANFDLVVVGVDEIAPPAPEEDADEWQAMRLATRYFFKKAIAIFVDGESGEMFDISVAGCQLMSPRPLVPGQEVHIVLPSEQTPVACTGQIVWVRLEPPKKRSQHPRYRAGMSFTKVDKLAVEAFATQRGATS